MGLIGIMLCLMVDLVAVERPGHPLAWRTVNAEGNTAMLARIRAAAGGSLLPRAVPREARSPVAHGRLTPRATWTWPPPTESKLPARARNSAAGGGRIPVNRHWAPA